MLLTLIQFVFGCNNDDTSIEINELFVIESDIFFQESFISLSNQNGDILFDTVGKDLRQIFKILIPESDKVDLTYGYETEKSFKVVTYRDIKSGFFLSQNSYDCSDEFTPENSFDYKFFELEIEGIHQYRELYYPFDYKEDAEIDLVENKLKLVGSMEGPKDIMITVLKEGANEYQSVYLKIEDWLDEGDNHFFRSISIDDFTTSEVYEIALEIDDKWMVNAEIQIENDRIISLSKWTTYSDYQDGNEVKLFMTPGIDLNLIKLEIRNGNVLTGYRYLKKTDEIPSQINFYDPEIGILEVSATNYEVSVNEDYNLSMVEYQYVENNWISSWRIYQKQSGEILNTLPMIPNEFLIQSPILNNQLSHPENIIINIYEMADEELEEMYNMTGIDRQLKCVDYLDKYIGKEL